MRDRFVKHAVAGAAAAAVVVALAGCTPSTIIHTMVQAGSAPVGTPYDDSGDTGSGDTDSGDSASHDAGSSDSGFSPVEVNGPVDWTDLDSCDDGSGGTAWVLVETFPADEIDAAGIAPFCGDTFVADDGNSFVGAVATITEQQIFLLGGTLVSAGYALTSDDITTGAYGGTGQYIGAREYTLGDAMLVVSAYDNGVRPLSLTVFLDYYSPQTRALAATSAS